MCVVGVGCEEEVVGCRERDRVRDLWGWGDMCVCVCVFECEGWSGRA